MPQDEQPANRRAGGRKARQALRAAPLADDIRPVRPGLEGGAYRPLTDAQCDRIHAAALSALAEIGMGDAPESGVAAMVAAGAEYGADKRLRFRPELVAGMLETAARDIALPARDPRFDLQLSGGRVHYGTAGAAVHMVDAESGAYRDSTLKDLYDAARIVDQLEHVHFFQRPMVARDVADPREMDLNTLYASVAGSRKHVGTSFVDAAHVREGIEMLHLIAGGEGAWRSRPFVSLSCTFVVPPMKFGVESCLVMEAAIEGGMPVLLLSAGQAGATAPAALAGAVVQAVAECLAGIVYVNALKPGHPAIFGTWPFVSDLRTGAMSGGSGEQALLSAACAQMGRYYGLPCGSAAGMTDSKAPDAQAGYERGVTNVMAGLTGLNMVYESVGMHASLLGFCHESAIIDNDLLGQCMRCVRGLEVSDETLSLDTMRRVCIGGPGHYLGQPQTLALMERDYVYPVLGDRDSPGVWAEKGRPSQIGKAIERRREILAAPASAPIPGAIDQEIRQRFPVKLARQAR